MKKLLVVAMVAFSAVMAQATTFTWSVSYNTQDASRAQTWVTNGAVAMVFAASSFEDVKKLIGATQTGELETVLKSASIDNATLTVKNSTKVVAGERTATVPDGGKVVIAIFTDGKFTADTTVYWTAGTNVSVDGNSFNAYASDFNDPATIAKIKEDYPSESLPEPGLVALLALGGAGLALRRKVRA